jgi:hypothetical protein
MCAKRYEDGECQCMIDFHNNDSNGSMSGTLTFMGEVFEISGNWAAAGSVPGRNASAFGLYGINQDNATDYIGAVGTMKGPGASPDEITLNLCRSSSGDGLQYGWSGTLLPDTGG